MKQIVINIPEDVELIKISFEDGYIVKVFEKKEPHIPIKGEVVKVKRNGKYKGIAVIKNYNDNSFIGFVTSKHVYVNSRFTQKMEFEKASMNDIQNFFIGLHKAGFDYNPESMTFIRKIQ